MRGLKLLWIGLPLLVLTFGCADEIMNVKDAPVRTLSGQELTLDQTTKAIVLAGMGLKWDMQVVQPGHIVGILNLRGHQAVVDITYNTKAYSITYKSSKRLLSVDETGKVVGIHPNYKGWIQNLDNAIRREFVAIGT